MDVGELYGKLPEHSLLRSLSRDELAEFLKPVHEHKARKGDVILNQGDKSDFLVIILAGKARVTIFSSNGREIVLDYVSAGDVLGEIALLDGGERTASVIATEQLRYVTLARATFERLMKENHNIALRLMRELAQRLRQANHTIETDRSYGAAPRLARFLLRLLQQSEGEEGQIKISQTELAMFAGISRENINRQISQWAQDEIVQMQQGKIQVLDVEALEEIEIGRAHV